MPKKKVRSKVPHKDRARFQKDVEHHIEDLGMPQKQAIAVAYSEERARQRKRRMRKMKKVS